MKSMKRNRTNKKLQNPEDRSISFPRVLTMIILAIISAAAVSFMLMTSNILLDDGIIAILISIVFGALFLGITLSNRIHNQRIYSGTGYRSLLFFMTMQWILVICQRFLPGRISIFLLLPFLIYPFLSGGITIGIGIFDAFILSVTKGLGLYSVYGNMIQILFGTAVAAWLFGRRFEPRIKNLHLYMMLFVTGAFVPYGFDYLANHERNINRLFIFLLVSLGITLFVCLFYGWIAKRPFIEKQVNYANITDHEYSLLMDMKHYSLSEYDHALRVSYFSKRAARLIGKDENLCEAAGLYYRLGKIYDGEGTMNAVREMEDRLFPEEVIRIVYEYEGIQRKPQTMESAIVQMVDAVVTRVESLDRDSMHNGWNQDMVVYQTLNDYSSKGMYDECGLSMNQYLAVRDLLVKEDILA